MIRVNLLANPQKIVINSQIQNLIKRRRFQMMVHSCIYYYLDTTIITDATFDKWAYELRDLQKQYPNESKRAPMYEDFKDWDGTTGFKLNSYAFMSRAQHLVELNKGAANEQDTSKYNE